MPNQNERTQYLLPSWRFKQISELATRIFIEEEFFRKDFDTVRMLESKDINVLKYSKFSEANLKKMQKFNVSFWKEGLCLVQSDSDGKHKLKMIAYDDTKDDIHKFIILMHEFSHIILEHSQQSVNGEAEANVFTTAMLMLQMIFMNKKLHDFVEVHFKGVKSDENCA
ncbi:MAG: hypothetical protein KBT11_01235 [Treponema sp.]|nr:hypothetical protein [Candidatus Treponema equifaecale]